MASRSRAKARFGKAVDGDHVASRMDHRVVDRALQFADIARPVVLLQGLEHLGGDRHDIAAERPIEPLAKVLRQDGNVLLALA